MPERVGNALLQRHDFPAFHWRLERLSHFAPKLHATTVPCSLWHTYQNTQSLDSSDSLKGSRHCTSNHIPPPAWECRRHDHGMAIISIDKHLLSLRGDGFFPRLRRYGLKARHKNIYIPRPLQPGAVRVGLSSMSRKIAQKLVKPPPPLKSSQPTQTKPLNS